MFKGFQRTRKPEGGELLESYKNLMSFFCFTLLGKAYPLLYSITNVKTHLQGKICLEFDKISLNKVIIKFSCFLSFWEAGSAISPK